jgi:hypothetical protein
MVAGRTKVGDFAAPAQSTGDHGKHRQGEQREQAQGRLDQDGDGKVPPDSMGVNVAEDKGGVVLRHDFHVNEAHQFGLGKQVPVRKRQDHGLVEMAQA